MGRQKKIGDKIVLQTSARSLLGVPVFIQTDYCRSSVFICNDLDIWGRKRKISKTEGPSAASVAEK